MGVNMDQGAGECRDERGATATEYGLLVGFIAMIIVVGVALFGVALGGWFTDFATWVTVTF